MKKILIANRGEIASRIIHTCKRLGIETIAVYSEADARHAVCNRGGRSVSNRTPPVQQSYLKGDAILAIAVREGVDGIHPGYGLLSENAEFASKVQLRALKFIGPDAETIAKMGEKIGSQSYDASRGCTDRSGN